eukprot:TRINITY_DN82396_c0_g1_i1.p1 TRINITY_DN82396_c0_g1~~TRINITY_DN82396_c0_g1_i1.p1  ORF type:complete len:337 (-),score=36.31 TRINITY_DN82396_c0_g1_i1:467-1477(-)
MQASIGRTHMSMARLPMMPLSCDPVASLLLHSLDAAALVALRSTFKWHVDWHRLYAEWISRVLSRLHLRVDACTMKSGPFVALAGCLQRLSLPCFTQDMMLSEVQTHMLAVAARKAAVCATRHGEKRPLTAAAFIVSQTFDVIVENGHLGLCRADYRCQTDKALYLPVDVTGDDGTLILDFQFDVDGAVSVCADIRCWGNSPNSNAGSGLDAKCSNSTNFAQQATGGPVGSLQAADMYLLDVRSVCQELKLLIHGAQICTDGIWRQTSDRIYSRLSKSARVTVPVVVCLRELPEHANNNHAEEHDGVTSFANIGAMNLEPGSQNASRTERDQLPID